MTTKDDDEVRYARVLATVRAGDLANARLVAMSIQSAKTRRQP